MGISYLGSNNQLYLDDITRDHFDHTEIVCGKFLKWGDYFIMCTCQKLTKIIAVDYYI